jgi:DNA-binding SARP family transcriptional activator
MPHPDLLLRTKLSPPQRQRRVLARPALLARLREAREVRLTVVQAGTGYSKTTALAALDGGETPVFWYSVGEADADPQRFLAYLIEAVRLRLPGLSDLPLAVLHEGSGEGNPAVWTQVLDALINALADADLPGPALLILDDYHLVADTPAIQALIEHLITYLPPDLHLILSTRYPLPAPNLVGWRVRGEVLEIDGPALAFSAAEIEALFRDVYQMPLTPPEVAALAETTEGWPIALQLVWQGLRGGSARSAADLLAQGSPSLGTLFEYLAREVLGGQPPEIAAFLRQTAILRELTPAACDAVRATADSAGLLERLHERALFVVALGERHYRYHHLFHDFLRQQAEEDAAGVRTGHRRAAAFFHAQGTEEEAIYHWLAAGDRMPAAAAIEQAGEAALRAGWLDTVARWIDALPPDVLAAHPLLEAYLGDVYRLRSRFDEALAWYSQAEGTWRTRADRAGIGRALRGQALVYLDTVRPAQAESLLEEALRLTDGLADREARARLLELLAENKLNMGKPDEAERLRVESRTLREEGPGEDTLSVRVKLRTGQVDAAQRILQSWASEEREAAARGQVHPPRAHRETTLLLALIHAFRGEATPAFDLAQEGIALGARLDSPFVTAVAHTRLGHAWQIRYEALGPPALQEAIRCYETAMVLGDQLSVRRMRAEVMWGLTRAYGFGGDLDAARRAAAEAVETGRWAGDAWIVALGELALGASHLLAGQASAAADLLARVLIAFRDCGDRLGRAATRLWLALAYSQLGQAELSAASADEALALAEAHGYDFLFTAPSLLSPPNARQVVPLLLAARRGRHPAYVAHLLAKLGLQDVQVHPGYQLRVQTLGAFRVWRGSTEVESRAWQRATARQLFQLLLAQHGRWLQREEITERLWPALGAEAAGRDFKVALNALNKALEPDRAAEAPFAFIVRDGTAYRIRPEADLWLDTATFEAEGTAGLRALEQGAPDAAIAHFQAALRLYGGPFLPDALYEDWASAERERLLALYLRVADKLAGALVERGCYDEALDVCGGILDHDACWERAYRLMMVAYARQNNRALALRTYQRCVLAMREELDMAPSPATTSLYQRILQAADALVTEL